MYRGFQRRYHAPEEFIILNDERIGGRWVYGSLLQDNIIVPDKQEIYVVFDLIDDPFDAFEVIPETVCACTGLKDRNGELIFEGDRLGISEHVVRYVNGGYEVDAGQPLWIVAPYCEIVGNIFEE